MKKFIAVVGLSMLFAGCSAYQSAPQVPESQAPTLTTPQPSVAASSQPTTQTETTAPTTQANHIEIQNFSFGPASLTVKAGSTVTVTNEDSVQHNVAADDKSFRVELLSKGQTASFTAPRKPGSYTFHCEVHPHMTGTLVVQ